jgi:ketosteroid isomerase-like protein
MSQENVEIVRAMAEAWNPSEPDFSNYHPALVYHPRADEPDASLHVGRDAFEGFLLGQLETLPDMSFEIRELIDAGNHVIASTVVHARGIASGADVADAYVFVYKLREGLIVEGWEYRTKEEALEAVGLSEQDAQQMS